MAQRLKMWPEAFDQLVRGNKRWSIRRRDDRQFKPGEIIDFVRWDPRPGAKQEAAYCRCKVTEVTFDAGTLRLLGLDLGFLGSISVDGQTYVPVDKLVPMVILTLDPQFAQSGEPPAE